MPVKVKNNPIILFFDNLSFKKNLLIIATNIYEKAIIKLLKFSGRIEKICILIIVTKPNKVYALIT